jgi:hypothetical protein
LPYILLTYALLLTGSLAFPRPTVFDDRDN